MTTETLPALRNDTVIVRLEAARAALSEAKTIQQSKSIADVAAAAEIYARRQKLGEEAIDFAHAVKIEALRKLGEILKGTRKADGGDAQRTRFRKSTESPPTLAEMGIDKKTSSMAQKLAALPEKAFEEVKEGHKSIGAAIAAVDAKSSAAKEERDIANRIAFVQAEREKPKVIVTDAKFEKLYEKVKAELAETKEALAEMADTAASAEAFKNNEEFKAMQNLRIENRALKQRRGELMREVSELKKDLAYWKKKAGKSEK